MTCGETYANDEIEITSDFECGNGERIRRIDENHFALDARRDWGRGDPYSMMAWYFCVRVRNSSPRARSLKFDVQAVEHADYTEAYVWAKRGDDWDRAGAEVLPASGGNWAFRTTLRLAPGEKAYLANSFWYPPSEMMKWLTDITQKHPDLCTLECVGRTAGGRPIPVLSISDSGSAEGKQRLLVAASPQGSEMGAWACHRLIETLLGEDAFAKRMRKRWLMDVVPQTNPDGEALGTVMVNAEGENPLFEFDQAAHSGSGSAEALGLWNWAKRHPPLIYLEYHCYYQANRPSFRPYIFSEELHRTQERRANAAEVARRLLEISTGPAAVVEVGDERFSKCFPYQLIEHLDTVAHFYKLHCRESLEDNLNQAMRVFKSVVDAFESAPPSDDLTDEQSGVPPKDR